MSAVRMERNGDGDQLSAIVLNDHLSLSMRLSFGLPPISGSIFRQPMDWSSLYLTIFNPPLCTGRKVTKDSKFNIQTT